jgi:VanZ family protein
VVHIIEYAVLALLVARAIFISRWRPSTGAAIFVTAILVTLYGISDEIHQAFVPGRNASLWDVLADGMGGVGGVLFYITWIGRRDRKRET